MVVCSQILFYDRITHTSSKSANGGFFMLTPNKEDYKEVQKIIERREKEGYDFNETIGFGHRITPPDHWEPLTSYVKQLHDKVENDDGQIKWDFYGSFTDQGLLYHWTKYVKKKLTIINGNKFQTWGSDENGILELTSERPEREVFANITRHCKVSPIHRMHAASISPFKLTAMAPYMDFQHFKGKMKP